MNEEKYDIELIGDEKLIRKYDYLPYTYNRIEAILREFYHADLIPVSGYKEGRYNPNYRRRYNIVDIITKEVVNTNVYLDDLRCFLANKNFPLRKDDTSIHMRERHKGAQEFMEAISKIKLFHKDVM